MRLVKRAAGSALTFGPGASVKRADVVQVINALADVSPIAVN